jgi:hypothetical protein
MVLQLCLITVLFRTIVLLGVCLQMGGMSILDKAMAFLWTIYLICGPNEGLMRWLLDKITSVTTDMGAELGIIDQPDMLPAFLAHLAGASILSLRGTVPRSSRLIRYALRISGWSHMWGNLMAEITRHVDR